MKGEGFKRHTEVGDEVAAGRKVVEFDLAKIRAAGHSVLSPVSLPDLPENYVIERTSQTQVRAGVDVLFAVIRKG
jgi:phosphotransferase system IIA component